MRLNEVIGSVRIGRAEACSVRESGSWGMRYPPMTGSGFHMVLRGSAWLITADNPPRELAAGDVVLTPFGAQHGLSHMPASLDDLPPAVMKEDLANPDRVDVEFLCGAYWLGHGRVHRFLRSLPDVIAVSPDYEGDPQLRLLAELFDAHLSDTGPGAGVTRPALLDLVLTHVLRQWLVQNRAADWLDISDPAISTALRDLHAAPHRRWTVQQLSETAGMSRTAFTKRFSALVGQPPMAYLTGWRLTYAARLLRETDAPLAAIAHQVGYSTEFAFGAAFRREYGISPGRFRQSAS
ncbi:AraC family transcriptional regulator [Streptomyces xiangluensis]|uniref:AraC family transcriptional regulator n=1 Tax=Streptomyces xiangluensis TaxID=2665720 RepID=A0ABV8Z7T4_9ACTN